MEKLVIWRGIAMLVGAEKGGGMSVIEVAVELVINVASLGILLETALIKVLH